MKKLDKVNIDVLDRDRTWFEGVIAYLDREYDNYYFPLESVERLGELDEESGNYYLIDSDIEAEAEEIEVGGQTVPAWCVGCERLIVRPARSQAE